MHEVLVTDNFLDPHYFLEIQRIMMSGGNFRGIQILMEELHTIMVEMECILFIIFIINNL